MLGVKSNRESIKGVFAAKLREQISGTRKDSSATKAYSQDKKSEGPKKQ